MRLNWFWSTNPQKVRLALEELGLKYELNKIDLYKAEHKTEAYRSISPRGTVPSLEIDGSTLWESNAILLYLGQREQRLWPSDKAKEAKALNLLFMESAAFQTHASQYYFNRIVMPYIGKEPDLDRIAKASKKIRPLLTILAEHLGDQDYLLGEFSLVDCSFAPWLPVLDLDDFPSLVAWRTRLTNRESWSRCEFPY
jgi:glutathione S-transferase